MPTAVSDLPPRKGPICRHFSPCRCDSSTCCARAALAARSMQEMIAATANFDINLEVNFDAGRAPSIPKSPEMQTQNRTFATDKNKGIRSYIFYDSAD